MKTSTPPRTDNCTNDSAGPHLAIEPGPLNRGTISSVSSAGEHACPLNGDLKLERIDFAG